MYNEHDERGRLWMYFTQWRLCGDFVVELPLLLYKVATTVVLSDYYNTYELVLDLKPPVKSRQIANKPRRKKPQTKAKYVKQDRGRQRKKNGGMDGHNYAITRFCRSKLWLLCEPGELEQNRSFNFTWNDFITHTHSLAQCAHSRRKAFLLMALFLLLLRCFDHLQKSNAVNVFKSKFSHVCLHRSMWLSGVYSCVLLILSSNSS